MNEKWKSISVVPVDGLIGDDDEWFVFSMSDSDFIAQGGYLEGGAFKYSTQMIVGILLITRLWYSRFICLVIRGLLIGIRGLEGENF